MTNPQIEVVKKWLDNPKSVSLGELKDNRTAALDTARTNAAYAVACHDYGAPYVVADTIAHAAACAAYSAGDYGATNAAARNAATNAAYWVKCYEELTND